MSYYSQFGEDQWIAEHLVLPQNGVFCEVGAYDGVGGSNTLYFEREKSWRGVLIEPVPSLADQCIHNRLAETWCCAAGPSGLRRFMVKDDPGAGGLEIPDGTYAFLVVVCGLEELVVAAGFQNIDLLSIDTEGTELKVWATRGRLTPSVVIMEYWTQPHPKRDKEIVTRMFKDGYFEVHRTEANIIFINNFGLEKGGVQGVGGKI